MAALRGGYPGAGRSTCEHVPLRSPAGPAAEPDCQKPRADYFAPRAGVPLVQDNEATRRTTMTAQLKAETGILNGGPDLLLARAGEAVAAAERVLIAAKTGVRAKVAEA